MPLIDIYAAVGTFRDTQTLASDLDAALTAIERVPDIPLLRQSTALASASSTSVARQPSFAPRPAPVPSVTFSGSPSLLVKPSVSGDMQEAELEQVELGPAVHLPFQDLKLVHLTLGLAVAVGQGRRSSDRCMISQQPGGEALKLW